MDWFLYERVLRHERVNEQLLLLRSGSFYGNYFYKYVKATTLSFIIVVC